MPRDWYWYIPTVNYLLLLSFPPFLRFLRESHSELHHICIFRSGKSEPKQTDPLVWPRRDVSSAFLDVSTQPSIQDQQRDGQMFAACSLRSNWQARTEPASATTCMIPWYNTRDRSITHSLQRWVSTKSSISQQLECILIFIISRSDARRPALCLCV